MKTTLRVAFLAFLLLYAVIILVPPTVYGAAKPVPHLQATPSPAATPETTPAPKATPAPAGPEASAPPGFLDPTPAPEGTFTLRDTGDGEEFTVPEREFLAAVVACEMDLNSPAEALKAQAVAAYTYYCRQRQTGEPIACRREDWLVYVPVSAMEDRWGEDFDYYKSLADGVVDQVFGRTLTYKGKLALTCYFAISPGSTEAVENVWSPDAGAEHPYLQAVASPGDAFSDGYLSTADFTAEEFRSAAEEAFDQLDLSGPQDEWLTGLECTPSGTVKTALLGGRTVTGGELRSAFGLRSASFTLTWDETGFHFAVKGWGHGVGMSQAGAVFMAKRGADYREILAHYYPGTTLTG